MMTLPTCTRIWLVAGITDMKNGFNGLAAKVQITLRDAPCPAMCISPVDAAATRLNYCGLPVICDNARKISMIQLAC